MTVVTASAEGGRGPEGVTGRKPGETPPDCVVVPIGPQAAVMRLGKTARAARKERGWTG